MSIFYFTRKKHDFKNLIIALKGFANDALRKGDNSLVAAINQAVYFYAHCNTHIHFKVLHTYTLKNQKHIQDGWGNLKLKGVYQKMFTFVKIVVNTLFLFMQVFI